MIESFRMETQERLKEIDFFKYLLHYRCDDVPKDWDNVL